MTTLELLAPARDADTAIVAISHGADAVYMGASSHGARAAAANSLDDIRRAVEFAHRFHARVYATVNTLVYDNEIARVEQLIRDLYNIGVDALIVQDMGLLRMDIPPIALHASTQCDARTPEKARFLADCGFSQIVIPRELTPDEIRQYREAIPADTTIEAFVHGALCVSYSGDCQAGFLAMDRSANRGECPQMCRLPYDVYDGNGRKVLQGKHVLSLRDMCRLDSLESMIDAGVSSFKIEGRLKDAGYVKNVVAAYHCELNRIIARHPDLYQRSSIGEVRLDFTPDVAKSFNRGFTPYFITRARQSDSPGAIDTPKMVGEKIGVVTGIDKGAIIAKLDVQLSNGDGLGYFDERGSLRGFRVNRVEGNRIFPAPGALLSRKGVSLYRNSSMEWTRMLESDHSGRTIPLKMELWLTADLRVALAARGLTVTSEPIANPVEANTDQTEAHRRTLSKLGGTIFSLESLEDCIGQTVFIPASMLADLRRRLCEELEANLLATHKFDYRRKENKDAPYHSTTLTYHDNVANHLSRQFYADHGVTSIEPAVEVQPRCNTSGTTVMTTRYCLRRQLGACLHDKDRTIDIPEPMTIVTGPHRYELSFDCSNCRMKLITK